MRRETEGCGRKFRAPNLPLEFFLAKDEKPGRRPEQALAEIEKDVIKPIYLLYGPEYYYRRQLITALRQHVLKDSDPAFSYSEYDASDKNTSLGKPLDDLRTMPFFGGRRLVILEAADTYLRGDKDDDKKTKRESKRDILGRYAQSPSKTGVLALICDDKPDMRGAFVKAVDLAGGFIACVTPRYGDLLAWIRNRARELGKAITPGGAQAMVDIIGADLALIDSHMQMLITYTGDRKSITEDDVIAAVDSERVTEVWDLLDGVASKNAKLALESLDRLLPKSGMESTRLALIGGTLLKLRSVKKMLDTIRDEEKVIAMLRMHPFAAKKSIGQARRFTWAELGRALRGALETDIAIKTSLSRIDPRLAVEKFIIELCK